MNDLSINNFWKKEFATFESFAITPLKGWSSQVADVTYFVEPQLSLRKHFSDLSSRIWLVSAPGAVGKSTLAKKIAYEINALYVDLSQADTIGGNYIYGGLAKTKSQKNWDSNTTTLFIDALDEARLRVTNQSFMDFLQDLIAISEERKHPIVLFGRSGVIDDISVHLMDYSSHPTIFDIEYFDFERSLSFVKKHLQHLAVDKKYEEQIRRSLIRHNDELEKCISRIIESLDCITTDIKNSFSGYSPVLHAISTFILAESLNISSIQTETEKLLQNRILEKICRAVLQREQLKLKHQVVASFPNLSSYDLYNLEEQVAYLAARCQGRSIVPMGHSLQGPELELYTSAVTDLLDQHPFLDGSGGAPANAVFEAAILAHSMKQGGSFASTSSEATVNPLLAEFYFYDSCIYTGNCEKEKNVDSIHVAPIFHSISARIGQGSKVELSIEADDDDELAEVVISRLSQDAEKEDALESFSISHRGSVTFSDRVSNININAPLLNVEIGAGKDVELIAPIDIYAGRIDFLCDVLRAYSGNAPDQTISLEAANTPLTSPRQIIYQNVEFMISWPNDRQYPWSTTSQIGAVSVNGNTENLQKALFSFSRLGCVDIQFKVS